MANIIEFEYELDPLTTPHGVGTLDGDVTFAIPKSIPLRDALMQVSAITMSDLIPNVYNGKPTYNWDNTICVVSTNTSANVSIHLRPGLYGSAEIIAAEINKAINDNLHWWQNVGDPGLAIISDTVHNKIAVQITSAKLNPAFGNSFRLDIRYATTGTDLALTLGISEPNAYIVGIPASITTVESDLEPWLDTQGTIADIRCNLTSERRRNNTMVRTLARIIFAGKNTLSDNIWPPAGQISPYMQYDGTRQINYMNVNITARDGYPMLFLGGYVHISIGFYYSNQAGILLPIPLR